MSKARKKSKASVFILFTLKQIKIKDLVEIEKYINEISSSILVNAQLLNSNCPKLLSKISLLNQMVNINNDLSKLELIDKLEIDIDYDKKKTFFYMFYLQILSEIFLKNKK